jgi:outer membrane biosynthesis protein TonB
MASLRRLVGNVRLAHGSAATLVVRGICHRTVQPSLAKYASVNLARGYATATKTKTTKTATKKKPAAKKAKKPAAKKAKKPKKKVAKKKVVKKVAKKRVKKPVKPVKPKATRLPSSRAISGYMVYLQNQLKSASGPNATLRLQNAVSQWKALSDTEKEVHPTKTY